MEARNVHRRMVRWSMIIIAAVASASPAFGGPPYVTDDPEPTDYGHFEIYTFANGTDTRDGVGGEAGIDFNYGAAPDLQLTAVVPIGYDKSQGTDISISLGNVELARQDARANWQALVSLDEIQKAGHRARDLVQQILSFGRRQPNVATLPPTSLFAIPA